MLYGLSGRGVPIGFPYPAVFNAQQIPLLVAAIAWRETLSVMPASEACGYVSFDGGHGVMQLTSSFPEPGWDDPHVNVRYAWMSFIAPALSYWHGLENQTGDALVKLVAATYNEGLTAAIHYHASGNVDAGTTDGYGAGVLANYTVLARGELL